MLERHVDNDLLAFDHGRKFGIILHEAPALDYQPRVVLLIFIYEAIHDVLAEEFDLRLELVLPFYFASFDFFL